MEKLENNERWQFYSHKKDEITEKIFEKRATFMDYIWHTLYSHIIRKIEKRYSDTILK